MKIVLATVSPRRGGFTKPFDELVQLYLDRSRRYLPCDHRIFPNESKLLAHLDEPSNRTRPFMMLADSKGQSLSSEELASTLTRALDDGTQSIILAIGPADGWSSAAIKRADRTLSFGRITLPHELAAVVAAEQLYRALTIRAGHPYHCGH